jgi:hypothetical protein
MTLPSPEPIAVCQTEADYLAAAERWRTGAPFPVIAGRPLDRYRACFLPDNPLAVGHTPRPGVVLSTGSELSKAAGALLAAATDRPHRHLPVHSLTDAIAEHDGQLIAVVALIDELTELGDWPGADGGQVGVLTGRSPAALTTLIYRTLTAGLADQPRSYVVSHPMFGGPADADATDLLGLAYPRTHRPRLLVLRGQGRECSVSLLDSAICGRDPAATPEPVHGLRATPCLHGEGCFRTDLTDSELIPASELHATLVFTNACSSVAVGVNAYPSQISVSLGLLEGTAVAVIGAMGVYVLQRAAEQELAKALDAGLPLGEVVTRLAARCQPLNGTLARFGLLGDPALILPWPVPARARRGPALIDETTVAQLRHATQTVIPRLERLNWLGLNVADEKLRDIRRQIRIICARPYDPDSRDRTSEVFDQLASIQAQLVADLVTEIYEHGWNFGGAAFTGLREVHAAEQLCPNCQRPRAMRSVLQHRVETELWLQTLQCRQCGDVWWTTEPGRRSVTLTGPVDVTLPRGQASWLERSLENRNDYPVRGAVGFAFRSRRQRGLPPGWSQPCALAPGQRSQWRAPVDLGGYQPRSDTHTTPVVAVLDGIYLASMAMVQLAGASAGDSVGNQLNEHIGLLHRQRPSIDP